MNTFANGLYLFNFRWQNCSLFGGNLQLMYQDALITMKKILIILFAILLLTSCNRVSGTYVSDGSGLVDKIEFVGNNSCIVTYFGMKLPATYRIDKGYIHADAGQGLVLLFKIQGRNTLVGESQWNNAIFRKTIETKVSAESAQ